jgi:hypothetical protein
MAIIDIIASCIGSFKASRKHGHLHHGKISALTKQGLIKTNLRRQRISARFPYPTTAKSIFRTPGKRPQLLQQSGRNGLCMDRKGNLMVDFQSYIPKDL